jgi:zinc transport system substrate-binding protein
VPVIVDKDNRMKKIITRIMGAFLFFTALNASGDSARLKVSASIYPLAHFAEQVAGEFAEVTIIMPPGSEPHEYEPTPGDIKKVYESKIFLFNGAGLDPWAERLKADLIKINITVIEMTKEISFFTSEGTETAGVLHDHHSGKTDPHIWLDPLMAVKEAEIIRDTLINIDPLHEKQYRDNSTAFINKLHELHEKYEDGLKSCAKRDIVVTHDAFGYLSRRYNFNTHAITGISPEEEPSPRKMVHLAKLAIQEKIHYIFFEQLASPKLAETIAREVGAGTLVLNPLGGLTKEDIKKGRTYMYVMEENLQNLRTAMGCE